MELYTCQMSKHREAAKRGIPFLDVTVKSGNRQFAPTWDFLMKFKKDQNEEAHIESFIPLMRENFKENKHYWIDILKQDELVIACYCRKDKFCHRLLLVDIFEKICNHYNIDFEYKGEL